ncbi:hypothetical protein HMPREF3156_01667 [Neisseria sp. HMSC06F02]|nr:hypothetical protein HMPREF3156_01667 [Neisseria sp. HMSC06F02]
MPFSYNTKRQRWLNGQVMPEYKVIMVIGLLYPVSDGMRLIRPLNKLIAELYAIAYNNSRKTG